MYGYRDQHSQLLDQAARLAERFMPQATDLIKPVNSIRRQQRHGGSRLYRLFVPEELGGLEASPVVSAQIFERLAQGSAACGW